MERIESLEWRKISPLRPNEPNTHETHAVLMCRPGKYKMLCKQQAINEWGEEKTVLEQGEVVNIVKFQNVGLRCRGQLEDGCWVSICSSPLSSGKKYEWAVPVGAERPEAERVRHKCFPASLSNGYGSGYLVPTVNQIQRDADLKIRRLEQELDFLKTKNDQIIKAYHVQESGQRDHTSLEEKNKGLKRDKAFLEEKIYQMQRYHEDELRWAKQSVRKEYRQAKRVYFLDVNFKTMDIAELRDHIEELKQAEEYIEACKECLRDKEKEAIYSLDCSICMSNPKDHTLNCGHCFCKDCADKVSSCPICRTKITRRTKIFLV